MLAELPATSAICSNDRPPQRCATITSRWSIGSAASAAWADSGSIATSNRSGGLASNQAAHRGRLGFVPPPALAGDSRVDRAVADRPEQPGRGVLRRRSLGRELHERLLDHIIGLVAPLPRVEHQGSGESVDQASEQL